MVRYRPRLAARAITGNHLAEMLEQARSWHRPFGSMICASSMASTRPLKVGLATMKAMAVLPFLPSIDRRSVVW